MPEHLRPRQNDPALRAEVDTALAELLSSVNGQLSSYEQLRMLVVAREAWSIENGSLTPTMKIRRARIEASVAPAVDQWYASQGAVLWA